MNTTGLAQSAQINGQVHEKSAADDIQAADESLKPFVGLAPLGEENAKFLAGRELEVRALLSNLRAARLTLVYGPSGVGKSSILRAGVIATLRELGQQELNNFGTPGYAVAIMNAWAGDPFAGLAEVVREGIKKALDVETTPPLPILTKAGDECSANPVGLVPEDKECIDLVETLRRWTLSYGLELLIILDQFEEFFLYHDKKAGPGTFAREFPRAVKTSDLRVRFLLSLRDDSLYKLDQFQGSLPTLFDNRLQIAPLTTASADKAIHKAIDVYNESRPLTERVEIEQSLINAVLWPKKVGSGPDLASVDAVPAAPQANRPLSVPLTIQAAVQSVVQVITPSHASGAMASGPVLSNDDYVDLPYMQLVMSRLWEAESARWRKEKTQQRIIRLATLTAMGGAQAVVDQYLDQVMQNFPARERRIASECFYCMVTPGGSKFALTPGELEVWTRYSAQDINLILEKLADRKYQILRRVDKKVLEGTQTAYEAYHDRLALAMLAWHKGYQERRSIRWRRLLLLGILIIIALPVGRKIYELRTEVSLQEIQLEGKGDLVKTLETSIKEERSNLERLSDLKTLITKFTCTNTNAKLQPDAETINSTLEIQCDEHQKSINDPTSTQLAPRIYIHIQDEYQRSAAEVLKARLVSQKYEGYKTLVPGIEKVGSRNLKASQLRYFHDNTDERDFASNFISSLKSLCINVTPQLIRGYEDSSVIRPRHFELWLSSDALNNLGCVNNNATQ